MTLIETIMNYIGQFVVYGGGAVAIGFGLFKAFGEKWLDSKFATRLQAMKSAQDEQLRYVQSFIDREIHRARKLYDREFDTLSEAWRLFCASFGNGMQAGMDQYPQLDRYTKEELSNLLSTTDMRDFEKADMLAMDTSRWTEHFRRWANYKRYNGYLNDRWAFKHYLQANAIFFSAGIKERFEVLDNLIGIAISEMHMRLQQPSLNSFDAAVKLAQEGPKLKDELEAIIAKRLWSSDAAKITSDEANA